MVKLRFETDLGTSLKAVSDLNKATDKLGKSWNVASREAANLERAAKRIVDQNLTPQERYNQKLETMAKAVRAGRLSMEDAARAAERMRARLDGVGQASGTAFGTAALAQVTGYAAGLFSVGAIIGGISKAFQTLEQNAQRAADAVTSSFAGYAALQGVSATPQAFAANKLFAQGLVREGVVGPLEGGKAAEITAALIKARLTPAEMGIVAGIGERDILPAGELAGFGGGARAFRDAFKGAGTFEAVSNKLLQAGRVSRAEPGALADALTKVAPEAAKAGFGADQALALFATVAQTSPNERTTVTRMRQIFKGKLKLDAGQQAFMKQQQGLISGAPGRNLIGTSFASQDPLLHAEDLRQREVGALQIEQERISAERELLFDTLRAQRIKRAGPGGFKELFWQSVYGLTDVANEEESIMRRQLKRGQVSPELAGALEDYLRRTAEGVEDMAGRGAKAARPSGRQQ